ncbi:MAG: MaoC family dehydratase [Solirubrobacteraceae bacterium]
MDVQDGRGVRTDIAGLARLIGQRVGPTGWSEMTQERVDRFADVTGDHQFIHVDVERARLTPFGGTIAHGFLSLALLAPVTQLLEVSDAKTAINYGLDKLRFPAPLPVGRRYRGSAEILDVQAIAGGAHVSLEARLEVEGSERPAVAATCLVRFYE